MKENKHKAKVLTIAIAVMLIIFISGVSFIVNALNKRSDSDTNSKLQADIIEYANQTQETSSQQMKKTEEQETKKENNNDKQEEVQQQAAQSQEPAMIVEREKTAEQSTILEEQKPAQTSSKTTEKWQKEVGEDLSNTKIDLSRQMAEMKGYWEAGNMKAVEDLAYLPRYRAASEQLAGTTKYYYYGDTDGQNRPHGKGLALYTDNQYYYGDWKEGVRSGTGMWIKYYVYDRNVKAEDSLYLQHSYSGGFQNDLPDGEGAEHYDFIEANMQPKIGYNRNFVGGFKNGLYHGEVLITDYYSDGNVKEWQGTAVNGSWTPLGEKDKYGQYPVIVQKTNADNYQWMAEKKNVNQGVDGLISAAKNN